jgi:two-component system, NtrC family, response regulator GlrR
MMLATGKDPGRSGGQEEDAAPAGPSLSQAVGLDRMVGRSAAFATLKHQVMRAARTDAAVLILGETGTGKELVAQAIHYLSARARKPFIPVNCGAIPASLFENELFGHRPGAFTDARASEGGLLAEAERGTLFLDELDALPLAVQVKLLRFLEERTYRPLGSARAVSADVRVVAATNADLRRKIAEGTFRSDLYYRLNLIPLAIPPLRARGDDILVLADHFLRQHGRDPRWRFSPEAVGALHRYAWPGNVRELENVIRRLVLMNAPKVVTPDDLGLPGTPAAGASAAPESFRAARQRFERSYFEQLLTAHVGNISGAARTAQLDRASLRRLLKKYQLSAAPSGV